MIVPRYVRRAGTGQAGTPSVSRRARSGSGPRERAREGLPHGGHKNVLRALRLAPLILIGAPIVLVMSTIVACAYIYAIASAFRWSDVAGA
jgi:hypothetical protein